MLSEELKEIHHKFLGKGDGQFIVLPNPLEETHHEHSEFFPDTTDLEKTKTSFLIEGFNKETDNKEETLLIFEQLGTKNIIFTDPRPLEDWLKVVNGDEKGCKNCLYKSNKGYSILTYGKWIIKDEKKYRMEEEKLEISNPNPIYLTKVYTQEKRNKIIELNRKST